MGAVRLRAEALQDLDEIASYIEAHDAAAARRVVQRIHHVIYNVIGELPLAGRLVADTGMREFPVPGLPYTIVYLVADEGAEIIAVFHTARGPATKRKP